MAPFPRRTALTRRVPGGDREIAPEGGFKLIERAPGVTVEQIIKATSGKLIVEDQVPEMAFK